MGQEVKRVLKEMKDKMIEEEQAKIELDKKKNKNKKGYVEPVLDTEKVVSYLILYFYIYLFAF